MSRKRCNKPNSMVFITRRTMNGATYFSLDNVMAKRLFVFLLDAYAKAYNIDVIAACLMGNHCHLILFDRNGVVSDFCREFFGKMAEAWQSFIVKYTREMRPDKIWDSRPPNIVHILHEGALVREVVYTILNPEHHGIVDRSEEYAGFVTTLEMIKSGRQIKKWRPPYYFRRNGGAFNKQQALVFKTPPNYSRAEWSEVVSRAIDAERAAKSASTRKSEQQSQALESTCDEQIAGDCAGLNPADGHRDLADTVSSNARAVHSPTNFETTANSDAGAYGDSDCQAGSSTPTPKAFSRQGTPRSNDVDDSEDDLYAIMAAMDPPCSEHEMKELGILHSASWISTDCDDKRNARCQPLRYFPRPRSNFVPLYAGPQRYQLVAREEYGSFIKQYQKALEHMLEGRLTVFPCGTTGMRMFYQVDVKRLSHEEFEARQKRFCEPLHSEEVWRYPHRLEHFPM